MIETLTIERETIDRPAIEPTTKRATSRELDVLTLMADGLSTREVARSLSYSERTIKNILADVTGRLELRNRTHAVAHAVRNGWI